jgi:hypothetical protein
MQSYRDAPDASVPCGGADRRFVPMLGPTIAPIDSDQARTMVNDESEKAKGFPG